MQNYRKHVDPQNTPQSEQVHPDQVQNSAGGFSFALDKWGQLDRFLILGSTGGTYYVTERDLTKQNFEQIKQCIVEDGLRVVNRVVEVSFEGRASNNDPALFVLAMCAAADDVNVRREALGSLSKVARTGTHLFHFVEFVEGFRGWGRTLKTAVSKWYQEKTAEKLAYNVVKYQQRDGWSHRDLLRLTKPKPVDEAHDEIYSWVVGKSNDVSDKDSIIHGFELAKNAGNAKELVQLIKQYNLPREAVPTGFLNEVKVWEALLQNMPLTALIRNLGKMTNIGLISAGTEAAKLVQSKLSDQEYLRKSRVHPVTVLNALKVYSSGYGLRGKLSWKPVTRVTDVLNDAFYASFDNVEPTGKAHLLALDVSSSMTWTNCAGASALTAAEGAAAMAMVTARVESDYEIMAFAGEFRDLKISPKDSLQTVLKKTYSMSFGATDCSLPMTWATKNKLNFDAFCVYTDSETWAGKIHPHKALQKYRREQNDSAKLVVIAMEGNNFSIADPNDAGELDVVGFSTDTPQVISEFIR